ncbi:hypothetical protein H5410_061459 [Solanum commersonii]|uniref:Uncharacterized protein n=1 Tax=Solanum commersonii TaxID=4109 RepID=A0A9J5W7W4_SOLCO|nr:hypothetical protein H5410_061459 [Solanum commersonii]
MTSKDECSLCQQGMACEKDDDEDNLYKIYDQFKELSLNVIDNDQVLELLQSIKDLDIRAQIIDKNSSTSTSKNKNHIPEEIPIKEGSYTMTENETIIVPLHKEEEDVAWQEAEEAISSFNMEISN